MIHSIEWVYHGSTRKITGPLLPVFVQSSEDHIHQIPVVFATDNEAIASLFMMPSDALCSIGYEQNAAYVCIWGTPEEFSVKDRGGYIYVLPGDTFEKRGKFYEWQSVTSVLPIETKYFTSVLEGLVKNNVRIYFIQDDHLFDLIRIHKNSRLELLKDIKPWKPPYV